MYRKSEFEFFNKNFLYQSKIKHKANWLMEKLNENKKNEAK